MSEIVSERGQALQDLWSYLYSWLAPDGGLNGPVVHRFDLKRMSFIHDTPWAQAPVIEGLITLFRRTGHGYWLEQATKLADAQASRQLADGSFKWAGHEDDRFSSLVHNALADCALLGLAEVLRDDGRPDRASAYLAVVENNINSYLIGRLYSKELKGFKMNPVDYYLGRDRFIVNMNSVAAEAMVRLDRFNGSGSLQSLAQAIGDRILELQCREGTNCGAFAYSNCQPGMHITIYDALTMRGLPHLFSLDRDPRYQQAARRALFHLRAMQDTESALWKHMSNGGELVRNPVFIAGAGIICNGIVDASGLAGETADSDLMITRLLAHRLPNGALRNFAGYDEAGNGRPGGSGREVWEDVFPTPGWNAHAFSFLCRFGNPPPPGPPPALRTTIKFGRRYIYMEWPRTALVAGLWPPLKCFVGLYRKSRLHGLAMPAFYALYRNLKGRLLGWGMVRRAWRRIKPRPAPQDGPRP